MKPTARGCTSTTLRQFSPRARQRAMIAICKAPTPRANPRAAAPRTSLSLVQPVPAPSTIQRQGQLSSAADPHPKTVACTGGTSNHRGRRPGAAGPRTKTPASRHSASGSPALPLLTTTCPLTPSILQAKQRPKVDGSPTPPSCSPNHPRPPTKHATARKSQKASARPMEGGNASPASRAGWRSGLS